MEQDPPQVSPGLLDITGKDSVLLLGKPREGVPIILKLVVLQEHTCTHVCTHRFVLWMCSKHPSMHIIHLGKGANNSGKHSSSLCTSAFFWSHFHLHSLPFLTSLYMYISPSNAMLQKYWHPQMIIVIIIKDCIVPLVLFFISTNAFILREWKKELSVKDPEVKRG